MKIQLKTNKKRKINYTKKHYKSTFTSGNKKLENIYTSTFGMSIRLIKVLTLSSTF